jgi:hypothetical protein
MKNTWKKVNDDNIVLVWKAVDHGECLGNNMKTNIKWFVRHGAPTCVCGDKMTYSHSEIFVEK